MGANPNIRSLMLLLLIDEATAQDAPVISLQTMRADGANLVLVVSKQRRGCFGASKTQALIVFCSAKNTQFAKSDPYSVSLHPYRLRVAKQQPSGCSQLKSVRQEQGVLTRDCVRFCPLQALPLLIFSNHAYAAVSLLHILALRKIRTPFP
jgi:hypothetical protein